jgi:ADP-ribose pyrophosphatase
VVNDKPNAEKVGWRPISTTYPFKSQWLRLRTDHIEIEGGDPIDLTYHEHPEAVLVVPVTNDGDILLIQQYRYTRDEWLLEVPAGGTHDTGDADLEAVARKELREETGASCDEMEYIGSFYPFIAQADEEDHVYIAWGARLDGRPEWEYTENIMLTALPALEAVKLARSGGMKSGQSALALVLCEAHLRERGYM